MYGHRVYLKVGIGHTNRPQPPITIYQYSMYLSLQDPSINLNVEWP